MAKHNMEVATISGVSATLALWGGIPPATAHTHRQPAPVVADLGNLSGAALLAGPIMTLRRLLQDLVAHPSVGQFVVSWYYLGGGHGDNFHCTYDRYHRALTAVYFDVPAEEGEHQQVSRLYRVTPQVIAAASRQDPHEAQGARHHP